MDNSNINEITIAIPKGRLYENIKKYFNEYFSNYQLPESNTRQYFYKDFFGKGINLFIAKPKSIPQLLDSGLCHFAFCGKDIMKNYLLNNKTICYLANTGLNKVNIVYAVKNNLDLLSLKRPIICATEYTVIAEKFLIENLGQSIYVLNTTGATEGYVHIGADCIIDVCETGKTIKTNGLNIENILFTSTTGFYGITNIIYPPVILDIIKFCDLLEKQLNSNKKY